MKDKKVYWLGATHATYNKDDDTFRGGNWWVHRLDTVHKDGEDTRYKCSDKDCVHCQ